MDFHSRLTDNKAVELLLFTKAWPTIIDFGFSITTKRSGQDHWGLQFCLVVLGWKLIEFNFYDVRHNDSQDD